MAEFGSSEVRRRNADVAATHGMQPVTARTTPARLLEVGVGPPQVGRSAAVVPTEALQLPARISGAEILTEHLSPVQADDFDIAEKAVWHRLIQQLDGVPVSVRRAVLSGAQQAAQRVRTRDIASRAEALLAYARAVREHITFV